MMSEYENIVSTMIDYIEDIEKTLQASKLSNEAKIVKNDVVKNILDKLDKETLNED